MRAGLGEICIRLFVPAFTVFRGFFDKVDTKGAGGNTFFTWRFLHVVPLGIDFS